MDSEKWQRCKQIFQAALDLPRPERAAYARAAAGDDEELYREVASLLDSEQRSHEFLSQAAANYLAGPLAADSAAHGRLKPGDLLAGRYRIVRLLGRGGMGEVYEAEDLELRAPIAVKLVLPEIAAKPEILDRFKREVLLARQVTHPNVCRIFDLGYHAAAAGRITFLTMEMLSGETLAARLERSGRMTVAEAYPLVEQLAAGLTAAHREGIVHRDFKSANVFLAPGEAHGVRVKIMDFGLARAVNGSDSARTTLTVAGLMIGTPAYMAPEQIAGGEITPATDIYALGIVMYEMVTGVLPFAGDTPWIVATKRLREAPPSPRTHTPELDPLWEAAILRCLEQNPADRYQTAADVMRALSGERLPAPPKAPVPPRRRRPRSVMPAALAMAFLLAALGGYYFLHRQRPSPGSVAVRFGWHLTTLPPEQALSDVTFAAGSIDPLKVLMFGPSFLRSFEPGQAFAAPLAMSFPAAARAECAAGMWLIHDDRRHLTDWDVDKQQAHATYALPWPVTSAVCLDEKATRWGFLVDDAPSSRWIEYDLTANRTERTILLDGRYIKARAGPNGELVALIASRHISVRNLNSLQELFHDELGETLLDRWGSAWSASGRYFAVGFKQLVVYDVPARKRAAALTTAGWTSGIGWVGDDGLGAMDDRGRLYWTTDMRKGWQLKQEPPAPATYLANWIAPHNRWLALSSSGKAQELIWDYIAPPLLFDAAVSPLEIWSVAASPDGSKLAVSGKDPRIFIVDLRERRIVRTLEGHTDGVPFVKFPQAGRLISASDDKTLRLWDTDTGKLLKTVTGHQSLINAFAIGPDGHWLVSVSSDDKIKLWRLPELAPVRDLGATATAGAAVAFLPGDNTRILVSDWKGGVYLYAGQPPNWSLQQTRNINNKVVYMVCPSQNAWWAAAIVGDGQGLWRIPAGDLSKSVRISSEAPYYCSTSDDGRETAIQYSNRVELWSNSESKLTTTYAYAAKDGAAVAITSGTPAAVVAGFADGSVLAWPAKPAP